MHVYINIDDLVNCNLSRYNTVDIGAILTHGKFAGDEDAVIERAKEAGT